MRKLIILSGPPGSGKSTFIQNSDLSEYTLCPDVIRLMFDAPQMDEHGSSISQKDNKIVFETMYNILEFRMKKGAFTVIDATHTADKDFSQYKILCKKYRYKMIVIPFKTSLDVLLERNKCRGIKAVPEEIIVKMKTRFDQLRYTFGTVIKPDEYSEYIKYQPFRLNEYKKINHIGDIHGCYTVLKSILPLRDDEFYVFLGDYFDRGIENAKVATWILKNYERRNVVFLRGNHENHLSDYVNDEEVKSSEFEKTIAEFEREKIKKKDLKKFEFSLLDVFLYTYHEKTILCSHGGMSKYPNNINFINPVQFIRGVGNYSTEIDEIFESPENTWQIHGHRNIMRLPIEAGEKSFNLTDDVELGGYLRTLTLSDNGFSSKKYKNDVFNLEDNSKHKKIFETLSNDENIKVNTFGNISSFNITRDACNKQVWNENTLMARGLFINNKSFKIVCRSYEKFFDLNENEMTQTSKLANLKYPIVGYVQENGHLGLLGVNEETEQLVFTSKNQIGGDESNWFESIIRSKLSTEQLNKLRLELLSRNSCLVFEVVDEEHQSHIINYNNEKDVILLEIVTRDYDFCKKPYNYLVNFAHRYAFSYKRKALTIHSYDELCKIIDNVENYTYNYKGSKIEGFVIEDGLGFQFKLKTGYYKFWENISSIINSKETYDTDKLMSKIPKKLIPFAEEVLKGWKETASTLLDLKNSYK